MTYTDNALTMNSGTYSGTLTKADAEEQANIEDKVSGEVRPLSTATASDYGRRRQGVNWHLLVYS